MFEGELILPEKLFNSKFWNEPREFSKFEAWLFIVHGCHKEGFMLATIRSLAKEWNWSRSKVERYIARLVDLKAIKWQPHAKPGTKIRVTKIQLYRGRKPRVKTEGRAYSHGSCGMVELTKSEHDKLIKKYGDLVDVGIDVVDGWIFKKKGQKDWFDKNYSSAFNLMWREDSWVWEKARKRKSPNHGTVHSRPKSEVIKGNGRVDPHVDKKAAEIVAKTLADLGAKL